MSNNIDAKYNTLGLFNYVGVQEDRELQFYNSYGITSTNIRDAENEFLGLFGYASGSVTDRWDGFLRSRGFTGSVDDMLVKFWELVTASLDLNFVNNNYASSSLVNTPFKNKSFNDAITFSRGTNATYVDSLGNITYAPSNLLTYSEQFDNAAWTKTNSSIAANAVPSPDGTATADKLIEASDTNLVHQTAETGVAVVSLATYTASCYVKADTRTRVRIAFIVAGGGVVADADLSTSTISAPSTFGGGTAISSSIQPLNNGWFRISVVGSGPAGTSGECRLELLNASGNRQYNGDGVSGLYIWGAQLNLGALQPYNSTTVKNLLGYTQDFDNAAWTKSNSSITQNVITAPDGSLTADKFVEDTTANVHYISQAVTLLNNAVYTRYIYAKAGGRSKLELQADATTYGGVPQRVQFDLVSASSITLSGSAVSSISPVGNGWFLCGVTYPATTTAGSSSLQNRLLDGVNNTNYTGDGTSGIYIWGAQLSDSASLDPYSYNFTTAPTAAAYYGPRFDYDPVTLACKGLLIEEQRTNSIRNNTMQGAVVGTPGTSPTNWSIGGAAGLTTTIVGTGVESGISYIDIRLSGTTTGTFASIVFDSLSGLTTATSYTLSTFLKIVAGGTANVGTPALVTRYNLSPSGSVDISTNFNLSALTTPLNTNRISGVGTTAGTLTGTGICFILLNWLNGAAIDITLRIGLPQLELGAFATSVIPTATAAVTRAADVAVIQGANFSNWYNQSEGTLYAEISSAKGFATANNFGRLAAIQDPLNNNSIEMFFDGNANQAPRYRVRSGGANQVIGNSATAYTANTFLKASLAYAENNFAGVSRGVVDLTDTSGVVPVSPTFLSLGSEGGNINYLNGHIARIAYYPRRLADTDLVRITK